MHQYFTQIKLFFIPILLFIGFKVHAQTSVDFTQPLVADGGICNVNDTVTIVGNITATSLIGDTIVLAMDYGDNNRDTFKTVCVLGNTIFQLFSFKHPYSNLGSYQLKVKAIVNNVAYDSTSLNITLGNCQKASGSFFYDLNNNCIQEDEECGYYQPFVNFTNNGLPASVYIEPYTGKFNIPIYPGDSFRPPTGSIDPYQASIAPSCVGNAYPVITGAVSDYKVRVAVYSPIRIVDMYGRPAVCKGEVGIRYGAYVDRSTDWAMKFDLDDYAGIRPMIFSCGTTSNCYSTFTYTGFPNPGKRTITAYAYSMETNVPYGPLSKKSIEVDVYDCDTVIYNAFINDSANCVNDNNAVILNGSEIFPYITSNKMGDNLGKLVLPNGQLGIHLPPGDTAYIYQLSSYVPPPGINNIGLNDIPKADCMPTYITDADDTVNIGYKPLIRIRNFQAVTSGFICVGDTFKYNFQVSCLGYKAPDSLRVITQFSSEIPDTFYLYSSTNTWDTFYISKSHKVVTYDSNYTLKVWISNMAGNNIDSIERAIDLSPCAIHTVKIYHDVNKNCIQDANEPFLNDFGLDNNYFSGGSTDSVLIYTNHYSIPYVDLQSVRLYPANPLGKGYYSRDFTTPTCPWPSFGLDTLSYVIPLIDTVIVHNPTLIHGYNMYPETINMGPCDTLYKPVLKGWIKGNRNESNNFQFAYNQGNGAPYSLYPFPDANNIDNYNDTITYYYIAGPETPYTPGTYVPGYKLIKQSTDTLFSYIRPGSPLSVLQNCQKPKARLFIDENANCYYDSLENSVSSVLVEVIRNGQSQYTMTNPQGFVYFMANNGDSITLNIPTNLISGKVLNTNCLPNNYSYIYNSASNDTLLFAYDCNGINTPYDVALTASHNAFNPLIIDTITINPSFSNCDITSGQIILNLDTNIQFVTSNLSNYLINGYTITWNLDTLNKTELYPIKVAINTSNAPNSNWLCNEVTIVSNLPDINPNNNTFILCDTLLNVVPSQFKTGGTDSVYLQTGTPVVYAIFFENTTPDTINHVLIVDTLSPLLELNSLQILGSSHNYVANIINNSVIKFTFDSIQLAPNQSGNIQFSLLPSGTISTSTVIYNNATVLMGQAGILNSNLTLLSGGPIIDTTTNIHPEKVTLLSILIYPNPASQHLHVKIEGNISSNASLTIVDAQGKIMLTERLQSNEVMINTSQLPNGVYFLNYNDNKNIKTLKFSVTN